MTDAMLNEAALSEIEERCRAARAGPWVSWIEGRDHSAGSSFIEVGEGDLRGDDIELIGATAADQDFIAAARSDVPALLAEVRRLKALLQNDEIGA